MRKAEIKGKKRKKERDVDLEIRKKRYKKNNKTIKISTFYL